MSQHLQSLPTRVTFFDIIFYNLHILSLSLCISVMNTPCLHIYCRFLQTEPSTTLSPLDSPPNPHHEWSTTSRTPPFINGSPASTSGMPPVFKNSGQAEDVDATSFLNFSPEDDSGVAFNEHRLSLGSVLTESVASSAFFSAQSHLSSLEIDDDDDSLLRLSMIGSRGSDALSVSSGTSSQDTEGHARHATVTANTRANATVGRHISTQVIGVGRQQLHRTSGNANVEWTLGLGLPSPRGVSKRMSVADVPHRRILRSDAAAPSMLPSSDDSDSTAPVPSASYTARKPALRAPNIEALSLDQINLRARTKSESALGKRAPRGVSAARAGSLARNANDDWTLSMPLPFFSKSAKATAPVPRAKVQDTRGAAIQCKESQRDIVVTVAGVDLYPEDYAHRDQDKVPLAEDTASAAPNVFTVPRVVSVGSGIERATRSRSDAKRVSLLDDEAFDTAAREGSNSNLAKLDVLSRDLARFNDLLRHSRSLLEMRPGSSGSETQSDAGSFSSSVVGIFQGNEGLPGTSSLPRLQVCHDQVQVTSSAVPSTVSGARPSKSHLSAAKPKICSDVIQDQIAEPITTTRFSSLAPPAPGSGGYRTSIVSSYSSSSSATVTPTKDRSSAPFASPSAVSNTQKISSSVRNDRSRSPPSSSTPMVKSGLGPTSAIAPSLRKLKSAGSSRPLRIDTNTTTLAVTPIAGKDSLSGEITPKNASSVSPSSLSVPVGDDIHSTFLLEPLATSHDSRTVSSLAEDPAPTHTASAPARSRRASCSSLTVRTCANHSGSPSSKTSAECLTLGSSALPPPCLQSSTSCPTPSESSSPIPQASHIGAALQNGASKSKSTFYHDVGTSLKIKLPPSRSSSVSSIASANKTGSTRPVAPNLEHRIHQLRLLGVDASPLLISQTNSTQIGQEASILESNNVVLEVDVDSVCSGSYYHSARSSFSNGCTEQGMFML